MGSDNKRKRKKKQKSSHVLPTVLGVAVAVVGIWILMTIFGATRDNTAETASGSSVKSVSESESVSEVSQVSSESENKEDEDASGDSSVNEADEASADSSAETQVNQAVVPAPDSYLIEGVPHYYQMDSWPTGCESVAATVALQYSGVPADVDYFIDNCLVTGYVYENENGEYVGPGLDQAFINDPRSTSGCGCYAPVIINGMNKAISELLPDEERTVNDLTGSSLQTLCETYIANNVPVVIWATSGMREIGRTDTWLREDGGEVVFYAAEHCLVLIGYDETNYYFSDSLVEDDTVTAYERSLVEDRYAALGSQAIAITTG